MAPKRRAVVRAPASASASASVQSNSNSANRRTGRGGPSAAIARRGGGGGGGGGAESKRSSAPAAKLLPTPNTKRNAVPVPVAVPVAAAPVPTSRLQQCTVQLSAALDDLTVFIPPPILSIIAKLAVPQRGMHCTALEPPRSSAQPLTRNRLLLCAVALRCCAVQFLLRANGRLRLSDWTVSIRTASPSATISCF
jgi:hypothetical protein